MEKLNRCLFRFVGYDPEQVSDALVPELGAALQMGPIGIPNAKGSGHGEGGQSGKDRLHDFLLGIALKSPSCARQVGPPASPRNKKPPERIRPEGRIAFHHRLDPSAKKSRRQRNNNTAFEIVKRRDRLRWKASSQDPSFLPELVCFHHSSPLLETNGFGGSRVTAIMRQAARNLEA
jgi:hypothetical protein